MQRKRSPNNKVLRKQQGNALLYFAIILPVLIGMTGLVIDYGRAVWAKHQLQKAADAGAIAGAAYLPSTYEAQNKAGQLVLENYANPEGVIYSQNGDEYTVEVSDTIPTYFMKLFGHDSVYVEADATAITGVSVGGMSKGAFPFCIINPDLNDDPSDDLVPENYGKPYIIGYGEENVIVADWANGSDGFPEVSDGNGRGWRGALNLNDNGTLGNAGASDLKNNMIDGWPGSMQGGDVVPIQTGNITSIAQARAAMLGDNPVDWDIFDPRAHSRCSRVVFVPIVHMVHLYSQDVYTVNHFINGDAWDHENIVVDGFAPFFILDEYEQGDVNGDGKDKDRDWITGYFIPGVMINNYLPPNDETSNFGTYATPRLID